MEDDGKKAGFRGGKVLRMSRVLVRERRVEMEEKLLDVVLILLLMVNCASCVERGWEKLRAADRTTTTGGWW